MVLIMAKPKKETFMERLYRKLITGSVTPEEKLRLEWSRIRLARKWSKDSDTSLSIQAKGIEAKLYQGITKEGIDRANALIRSNDYFVNKFAPNIASVLGHASHATLSGGATTPLAAFFSVKHVYELFASPLLYVVKISISEERRQQLSHNTFLGENALLKNHINQSVDYVAEQIKNYGTDRIDKLSSEIDVTLTVISNIYGIKKEEKLIEDSCGPDTYNGKHSGTTVTAQKDGEFTVAIPGFTGKHAVSAAEAKEFVNEGAKLVTGSSYEVKPDTNAVPGYSAAAVELLRTDNKDEGPSRRPSFTLGDNDTKNTDPATPSMGG
jgi:hypothetical protein